jgi:tRNA 2-thiouridine synthesizing protein A
MSWDEEVDCEGLLCPLPVLRARKRLLAMAPGAVLRVRATDPMAAIDLPHFCTEAGPSLLRARDWAGRAVA